LLYPCSQDGLHCELGVRACKAYGEFRSSSSRKEFWGLSKPRSSLLQLRAALSPRPILTDHELHTANCRPGHGVVVATISAKGRIPIRFCPFNTKHVDHSRTLVVVAHRSQSKTRVSGSNEGNAPTRSSHRPLFAAGRRMLRRFTATLTSPPAATSKRRRLAFPRRMPSSRAVPNFHRKRG
jgi:hypothetical protein